MRAERNEAAASALAAEVTPGPLAVVRRRRQAESTRRVSQKSTSARATFGGAKAVLRRHRWLHALRIRVDDVAVWDSSDCNALNAASAASRADCASFIVATASSHNSSAAFRAASASAIFRSAARARASASSAVFSAAETSTLLILAGGGDSASSGVSAARFGVGAAVATFATNLYATTRQAVVAAAAIEAQ
eukprot:CAMPEP_0198666554 /NCGR_PEP_ID=MMETSP1467-20131203/65043_1 /TAXON_ID=1462469 /ORGANISM="unid. sp., Strain CCMP2135" /LENGTH=191 /DNA_ID=CAMNT_0044403203 /DNA_START=212 /DNA_END=784 /DNA_ORIENTATION=-